MIKRLTILILIVMALSFVVPQCLEYTNAQDDTIRVWFSHIERENAALRVQAAKFTQETGIKVEVISRRAVFDAPNDLVNYATLSNRPDVVFMQAPDIGGLVKSGYLEPLDIPQDVRDRHVDTALSAFTTQGKTYGIGYSIDTSGLIYNKDLIAEEDLPSTWDEFFSLAESLTIKDSKGDILQRGTLLNSRDMWFTYPIIKEYGGYYFGQHPDGTYNPFDVGLDNEGMIDYINQFKEGMQKGYVLSSQNEGESHISASFSEGETAMILYGLWSARTYQANGINYGLAPLPNHSNGEKSQPLATVQGFTINAFSESKPQAKRFLEFLFQDDVQQALIEAGNNYDNKTGERNTSNLSVMQSDYIQSDETLSMLSVLGSLSDPYPNIAEASVLYNYTFRTIFFSDGNAMVKLQEIADAIRRDVALMNYTAERIDIEWWVYLLIGVTLAILIVLIVLWQKSRNKKNPLYVKYEYSKKVSLLAWGVMLPMLILVGMFYVYPIIHNVYLSLTDYSGMNLREYGIIGLANYRDIFVAGINGLLRMIVWTIVFASSVVALSFVFGTFVATILDKQKVRIAKIYRLVFILPWVIPTVITLLMWQGLLETNGGLINQLLAIVRIPAIPWLSNPHWARLSSILVMTWFSFPYFMVVAFGVLKSIPNDYYEAARIDGAGNGYIFFKITLPLVFKALVPMIIMSFIMQFNQFGIYLLTAGGPPTDVFGAPGATDLLITYVFNQAFNTKRYAVAAAYSVIIFVFVGIFALISMKISKKKLEA